MTPLRTGSTLTDAEVSKAPHPAERASPWLLVALTTMNLLNYIDRYVVTVLLPNIQSELHLNDAQAGALGTAFIVVYFVVSPLFGYVGDRYRRPPWLAAGVGIWSLATAACALTRNATSLFIGRGIVGVGEAAYGTIAPSMLADATPKAQIGRTLSWFYLAIPVGSALGYLLGGVLGKQFGWRHAMLAVGVPGLLLAACALRLKDPQRRHDGERALPLTQAYASLLRNRLYVGTVAGYTASTFALGGLAFWAPSYMIRVRHFPQDSGMLLYGGMTVVTGVMGTLIGGFVGDRLLTRVRKAYTWVNIIGALGGAFWCFVALAWQENEGFMVSLAIAQFFLFLNMGPVNALIVGCVSAHVRASAMALSIFSIHLLGDAFSPLLIGKLSDADGLETGMRMIPLAFIVAALIWATTLPQRRRP